MKNNVFCLYSLLLVFEMPKSHMGGKGRCTRGWDNYFRKIFNLLTSSKPLYLYTKSNFSEVTLGFGDWSMATPFSSVPIGFLSLNHNLVYTYRIFMIFAPFESALESAFEWCKNYQNPLGIA